MKQVTQPELARLVILCMFALGMTALTVAGLLAFAGKVQESLLLAMLGIGNGIPAGMCALLASTKDTQEGQGNVPPIIEAESIHTEEIKVNKP